MCTTNWPLLSPTPKGSFPFYTCTIQTKSSSKKLFPVLHLHYNWPGLSPAPKSSFPYCIWTTNCPLLNPAPKSSFTHYICTTNWPGLTPAPQLMKRQVSKMSASYETSSKSEAPSLQNERFVQDFLQKTSSKSDGGKSPKRALRTRLPPKVKRQVSKTSASCTTSFKSEAPSLQNECFVQDSLQK